MTVLPMYRKGAHLLAFGRVTPRTVPVVLVFAPRTLSVEHGGQYHRHVTRIPKQTPQAIKGAA